MSIINFQLSFDLNLIFHLAIATFLGKHNKGNWTVCTTFKWVKPSIVCPYHYQHLFCVRAVIDIITLFNDVFHPPNIVTFKKPRLVAGSVLASALTQLNTSIC